MKVIKRRPLFFTYFFLPLIAAVFLLPLVSGCVDDTDSSSTPQGAASSADYIDSDGLHYKRLHVTKAGLEAETGKPYPLTVDSGDILANTGGGVLFETNGTIYAVNGVARGRRNQMGWQDIFGSALWKDNPDIPGTKVDIGPIIDKGVELAKTAE